MIYRTLVFTKTVVGIGLMGAVVAGALAFPQPVQIALGLGMVIGFLLGYWLGKDKHDQTVHIND